jgi:hypothetical protein
MSATAYATMGDLGAKYGVIVQGTLTSGSDLVSAPLGVAQGAGGIITGAYSGSVDFYISCDGGVTYERTVVLFTPAGSSGTPRVVDSIGSSTAGFFQFLPLAGVTHVGLKIPTYASGTVNCTIITTPQASGELTAIGVEGVNGPQIPRFVTVGGVDTAGLSRVLRIASKILFRDLGVTAQTIKASAGSLFAVHIENNQAAAAWIQIFDASAPTLGTTNPDIEKLVAANASADIPLPANGVLFGTAIKIASTTTEKGAVGSAAGVLVFAQYA